MGLVNEWLTEEERKGGEKHRKEVEVGKREKWS